MSDEEQTQQEMTDEEALMKIAAAMKENAPSAEDKQSVHTFLLNVVTTEVSTKVGNLRDDKEYNELGFPTWTVRGCFDMARVGGMIMDNPFFEKFFLVGAEDTLGTSLSRNGFLVKQATTQTKQVADVTKRRKINKGWFKSSTEESGGDTTSSSGQT